MNRSKSAVRFGILMLITVAIMAVQPLVAEESLINRDGAALQFFGEVEGGAVKVLSHTFQSGDSGTLFNFVSQGGQEILFPFSRIAIGTKLYDQHQFTMLYQPLTLQTQVRFREAVTIDTETFAAGTSMNLKYGFPFWRFTYGYDFFRDENLDVLVGGAIQVRNASIVFEPVNGGSSGSATTANQNLGIVPALYAAASYTLPSGIQLHAEATGIYASSALINGASFTFTGSLLDTSLRIAFPLRNKIQTYVNVRFLGGTSDGVSQFPDLYWTKAIEDYGQNNLATLSFTAGLSIR
jgi:hypothetical protein